MSGVVPMAFAALWTAVVSEVVIESARVFGASIVLFGRTLVSPGIRPGILILCGLAASAALAWSAAVSYARSRRLERRMAAELDERYGQLAAQAAGDAARAGLLAGRVAELRTSLDDLARRRDEVVAEMELARRRTSELRALSDDYKRSLADLQNRLIVLPEIEDELARRRAMRKATEKSS